MPTRIAFMGSPEFAVPSLRALAENPAYEILAVYTQPPRPAGRGQQLRPTPVHAAALELGISPIRHPEKLTGPALDEALALPADVFCVVGYGLLLPRALVEHRTCLNVHPSALPRWRGATPVQSALMAGDTSTDVCIMRLEAGMDTGPVYSRTPVPIGPNTTAGELNATVWAIGAERLLWTLQHLSTLTPVPQQGEATRAVKITAETRRIDWNQPAETLHSRIRALSPTPGAVAPLAGEEIKLLRTEKVEGTREKAQGAGTVVDVDAHGITVACGEGFLRILELQRPGKRPMPATEAARGWAALNPQSSTSNLKP